ncbi:MAG: phage tail sheath family protein, partial [Pseudomonadota bacterium]
MAVSPTYPGVYVQEVDSGVRTVAGVPTSIAAFVGVAERGAVNEPVACFNFGDFTRRFGGLSSASTMSYCVEDFFANGGGQCEIVRVFRPLAADDDSDAANIKFADGRARLDMGTLQLRATSPGTWGNSLEAWVEHPADDPARAAIAAKYAVSGDDLFTLTVVDTSTGAREVHPNLVLAEAGGQRRFDRVLSETSQLVEFLPDGSSTPSFGVRPAAATLTDGAPDATKASGGNEGEAVNDETLEGDQDTKTGMHALRRADIFNLLCIPPVDRGANVAKGLREAAAKFCRERRALFIVDPPSAWDAIA